MSAEVIELARTTKARTAEPVVRLRTDRPRALERLDEVCSDWLFRECGPEGRARLLREHDLIAA